MQNAFNDSLVHWSCKIRYMVGVKKSWDSLLIPIIFCSQLYRSSSFNSSGRSSTCDTADDMYSDASLEEDVHDLHHKVGR